MTDIHDVNLCALYLLSSNGYWDVHCSGQIDLAIWCKTCIFHVPFLPEFCDLGTFAKIADREYY